MNVEIHEKDENKTNATLPMCLTVPGKGKFHIVGLAESWIS